MLNSIVLQGRLGTAPEIKHTQTGKNVVSLNIAVQRNGRDAGTDWIPITAWDNTAELIDKYFNKGDEILVEGRLQARQYQDRDGKNRTAYEVIVNRVHFVSGKKSVAEEYNPEFTAITGEDEDLPF